MQSFFQLCSVSNLVSASQTLFSSTRSINRSIECVRGQRWRYPVTFSPIQYLLTIHMSKLLPPKASKGLQSGLSQIFSETSLHRISLMARVYPLGPSVASDLVVLPMMHGAALFRVESSCLKKPGNLSLLLSGQESKGISSLQQPSFR